MKDLIREGNSKREVYALPMKKDAGRRLPAILATLFLIGLMVNGCAIKPKPMTNEEISNRTKEDLSTMFKDQEPVAGPIDLYTAMARAVKYNLDYRLQLMEKVMAEKNLDVSRYDLLPQMAANAGYSYRDDYFGANSRALTGPTAGQQSLVTSTSQDQSIRTADLSVSWNVLDFLLGYYNAKQQADQVMVAEETRRRVIQNVLQDVRYAYYRAAGTEEILEEMDSLLRRAQSALEQSKKVTGQRLRPRLETLTYQRELLDNIRILWGLIRTLVPAQTELATLMNVKPGTCFKIVLP